MPPRSAEERKADTLALLESEQDAWIATASAGGAHLVPLGFWWDGEILVMTTPAETPTARNALATGQARVAVGPTRDVVMIAGSVEVTSVAETPESVRTGFVDATGWDPEWNDGEWVYLRIRPSRIQAWREADEIAGRTIMRDGRWRI